jgi:hypothetical protein
MNDDKDLIALTEFGKSYADCSAEEQERIDALLDEMKDAFDNS